MARVVVGLSGGVDSSVAAYLLKLQGHEVLGIYMQNWNDRTGLLHADCPFEEDSQFAALVAKKLEIPFEIVDLSEDYRARVIEYLFSEYARGRTPNPDVLCNREIKFEAFWEVAKARGADYVATGHYCRKVTHFVEGSVVHSLLAGKDPKKDQSYFLCQVSQEQLSHALFPVGELQKSQVRAIASDLSLATAARKDSYGICFVGKVDLPTFLSQKLAAKEGEVIEIPRDVELSARSTMEELSQPWPVHPEMGERIGAHQGAHFYTVGQRKGLGIGGKPLPLFVLAIDVEKNLVYVGQGHDHPMLNRSVVRIDTDEMHWLNPTRRLQAGQELRVSARLRYRQPLQEATLYARNEALYLRFDALQRGVTPGQFAAWYVGDELLGSGPVSQ